MEAIRHVHGTGLLTLCSRVKANAGEGERKGAASTTEARAGAGADSVASTSGGSNGGSDGGDKFGASASDVDTFLMESLGVSLADFSKKFPTNGCLSVSKAKHVYVVPPLHPKHPVVVNVLARQWCTLIGPRQQGKTTTLAYLMETLRKAGAYACVASMRL